tara:strand:+ start:82 stop:1044 length:963 start_codon:yes stop_codon:yes gene_type:complete
MAGSSVALSADGTILAVGEPLHDVSPYTNSGRVRVYTYDASVGWTLRGQGIEGTGGSSQAGSSVDISADGALVTFTEISNNAAVARVYSWNGSEWQGVGGELEIEAGATDIPVVAISNDSETIAVGQGKHGGSNNGKVKTFKANFVTTTTTEQVQTTISSEMSLKSNDVIKMISGSSVNITGNLIVSGTATSSAGLLTSDRRLKHNEENISDSLEIIRKLKPQTYQKTSELKEEVFVGELEDGTFRFEAGLIAQDILSIPTLSKYVSGGDYGTTTAPYALDYNSIFTYNVSATKELDTIVTNLLTKIATLEARITELENK